MKAFIYKKHLSNKSKSKKGFTLVEVLIACSIITITTFSLMSAAQKSISLSALALRQAQGSFLLQEGAEAVKSIRDDNWSTISSLALDTNYYLSYNTSTNTWSLSTTAAMIDSIFTRTIVLAQVLRDSNDDIASSGTIDARTKKVTVTVSWPTSSGVVARNLVYYMSDIFN